LPILIKHDFPKCDYVTSSIWQEENFTNATDFIPERWLDEECDPSWNREPRY
jgi:hypothetical protein